MARARGSPRRRRGCGRGCAAWRPARPGRQGDNAGGGEAHRSSRRALRVHGHRLLQRSRGRLPPPLSPPRRLHRCSPPNYSGCRFSLSPDGTRAAPEGSVWSPLGGEWRSRDARDSGSGSRPPLARRSSFAGARPAFKPDGTLTQVRDGELIEWSIDCRPGDRLFTLPGDNATARCVRTVYPHTVEAVTWFSNSRFAAVLPSRQLVIVAHGHVLVRADLPRFRSASLELSPKRGLATLWLDGELAGTFDAGGRPAPIAPVGDGDLARVGADRAVGGRCHTRGSRLPSSAGHRRRPRAPARHLRPRPGLALMRNALTWIVAGAVVLLLVVAIADAIRGRSDASGSPAAPAARLHGVIVAADAACQTKAYRLPSMAPERPPHPPDCNGLVWSQDGSLVARCRGDFTSVRSSQGIQFPNVDGCAPAWRADGALSVVLDGNIVIARRHGRPFIFFSRPQLAEALRAAGVEDAAEWRFSHVSWFGLTNFVAVLQGQPGQRRGCRLRAGRPRELSARARGPDRGPAREPTRELWLRTCDPPGARIRDGEPRRRRDRLPTVRGARRDRLVARRALRRPRDRRRNGDRPHRAATSVMTTLPFGAHALAWLT